MSKIGRAKYVWTDGRFTWPFVVTVAYFAAAVFLFDLAWRVMKMPIDELLIAASVAFAVSFAGLLLAFRMFSRGAKRNGS
jgi:hypothetical protein